VQWEDDNSRGGTKITPTFIGGGEGLFFGWWRIQGRGMLPQLAATRRSKQIGANPEL